MRGAIYQYPADLCSLLENECKEPGTLGTGGFSRIHAELAVELLLFRLEMRCLSKSVRLARYLQWPLLAALLVVPQGKFRTLDANASLANPGRAAAMTPILASGPSVVPCPPKATIALLAKPASENVQRQTLSEDEVIENHSWQAYAMTETPILPLTQKSRPWILSDSSWNALDNFPLRFDCQTAQGRPSFGLHVVLPFGG